MEIKTTTKNLDNYKIYLQVEEAVHEFMEKNKYLKIDLPVLSPALIPESYLQVFETDFKFLDKKEKLYLIPSPELFLKRLLAYGVGDCYYLGKSFRNADPPATLHSYEFVMLEFYKMDADYMGIADVVLKLLQSISRKLQVTSYKLQNKIIYKGKKISFEKWEKITVQKAFKKYAGISEKELFNHKLFIEKAKEKGYSIKTSTYEDL